VIESVEPLNLIFDSPLTCPSVPVAVTT
jgi:hypothetical protein